jgi:hypothetical protein
MNVLTFSGGVGLGAYQSGANANSMSGLTYIRRGLQDRPSAPLMLRYS